MTGVQTCALPIFETEMTRCIHCTRCVRFGIEIAGLQELGATGRGENMHIGTYIESALTSEMSGNIIDLCPVGALTAKPSRYTARAWELTHHDSIAPHDCVGSNIHVHTFRGLVNRVVPKNNESINECWLSDRDRFSYQGLLSNNRLRHPMIKVDGEWQETDWNTALEKVSNTIADTKENSGSDQMGFLVSPSATLEEMLLLKKLADGLDVSNIDYRLRQVDFSHQNQQPKFMSLGFPIEALDTIDAVLLVGSNPVKEQPIIAHRLRKAAKKGAEISLINHRDYSLSMPLHCQLTESYAGLVSLLAEVAQSLPGFNATSLPQEAKALFAKAEPSEDTRRIADSLKTKKVSAVVIGNQAINSPYYSLIEVFARALAEQTESTFGYLTEGANSMGACFAGIAPNRKLGGEINDRSANTTTMLSEPRNLYILHNVEPEYDFADPVVAVETMTKSDCVVCLTPFVSDDMKMYADILLPIAPFVETSGSYINIQGSLQSFKGNTPVENTQARPAWKIMRVLGNLLHIDGFEQQSSADVLHEFESELSAIKADNQANISEVCTLHNVDSKLLRSSQVNMYRVDNITRRATALQKTPVGQDDAVHINSHTATKYNLSNASRVRVKQNSTAVGMPLKIDNSVADDSVWIAAATNATKKLGPMFGVIELEVD